MARLTKKEKVEWYKARIKVIDREQKSRIKRLGGHAKAVEKAVAQRAELVNRIALLTEKTNKEEN